MKIKGQSHSLTLVEGHSDSNISNVFSLETARLIEISCVASMRWRNESEYKLFIHMIKMAAMFIFGKNF